MLTRRKAAIKKECPTVGWPMRQVRLFNLGESLDACNNPDDAEMFC
jgi:hypothetical protein